MVQSQPQTESLCPTGLCAAHTNPTQNNTTQSLERRKAAALVGLHKVLEFHSMLLNCFKPWSLPHYSYASAYCPYGVEFTYFAENPLERCVLFI